MSQHYTFTKDQEIFFARNPKLKKRFEKQFKQDLSSIKIFSEENWKFWGVLRIWKEIFYETWNTLDEVVESLKIESNYKTK